MRFFVTWAGKTREVQDHYHELFGSHYDGRIAQVTVGGHPPDTVLKTAVGVLRWPELPQGAYAGVMVNCEPRKWIADALPPFKRSDLVRDNYRAELLLELCKREITRDGMHGVWWPEPDLRLGDTDFMQCYMGRNDDPQEFRALVARRLKPYLERDGYDRSRLVLTLKGVDDDGRADPDAIAAGMDEGVQLLGPDVRFLHWVDLRRGADIQGVVTMARARAIFNDTAFTVDDVLEILGVASAALSTKG